MMKNKLRILILWASVVLCGCSSADESIQRKKAENVKAGDIQITNEETKDTGAEVSDTEAGDGSPAASKSSAPTKEEVLAMRKKVLEGMSGEEVGRLTENIKVANLCMESAYLNDNLFEKLEDPESLYWNYFDEKGDIQTGWAYDGSRQEMRDIIKQENLSTEEFYEKYGTPVMVYNRFDAVNFIELIREMKESVKDEGLRDDLQKIMDETDLAAKTHEMEHAYLVYQMLHDMDYYLLRYGVEDVGKYVKDISTVIKYYGVLSVYG